MKRKSRYYKSLDHIVPTPADQMRLGRGRKNTVCDVLRRIFNKTEDEEVRLWARIATTMTRKMNYKLAWYAGGETVEMMNNKQRRRAGNFNKMKRKNTNKAKRAAARARKAN